MESSCQNHAGSSSTTKKRRSPFTKEEDTLLCQLVNLFGQNVKSWEVIASYLPNRKPRQCRERYRAYLNPHLSNGPWNPEEDKLLRELVNEHGTKWASFTQLFKGRSDSNIKNRWYTYINKAHPEEKPGSMYPNTKPQQSSPSPVIDPFVIFTAAIQFDDEAFPFSSNSKSFFNDSV